MSRHPELARQLKARRLELKAALARSRREAREKLNGLPPLRAARARRRRNRIAVMVLLAAALGLLIRCECAASRIRADAVEPAAEAPAPPEPKPPQVKAKPPTPKLVAKVEPTLRGGYTEGARTPPSWIEEYRLQVAARSPRLAACFTGVERPGSLRWTASVNPSSGVVSDHELASIGGGAELAKAERECLIKGLSEPPYRLRQDAADALPVRMTLAIEF